MGRFILSSVRDEEGKRYRLIFPEGKGLVKGWLLLAEKGTQGKIVIRRQAETYGGIIEKGLSGAVIVKPQRCVGSTLWMDVSSLVPKGSLGVLHNCLVGGWREVPAPPLVSEGGGVMGQGSLEAKRGNLSYFLT